MAAIQAAASTLAAVPLSVESLTSKACISPRSLPAFGGATSTRRSNRAGIRCDSNKGPLDAVKDAVENTKQSVTEDSVKKNMQSQEEQKSVFGTKPVSGGTYPRPENERRPELGNTSFGSIMAFDGPGPETINGRLAMLGSAWAFIAEKISGQGIVEQVTASGSPGLFWLVIATNITIAASLIPIFNGESPDSRRNGPFTPQAERWNGRLAMVGFAGLLIFERFAGHSFF